MCHYDTVGVRIEFKPQDGVKPKQRPQAGEILFQEFCDKLLPHRVTLEGKMTGPNHMVMQLEQERSSKSKKKDTANTEKQKAEVAAAASQPVVRAAFAAGFAASGGGGGDGGGGGGGGGSPEEMAAAEAAVVEQGAAVRSGQLPVRHARHLIHHVMNPRTRVN